MKTIRQLLRSPLKSILGMLLLTLASVLLCISVGQYYAAYQMEAKIENEYTTIALPTNKYKATELLDENGNVIGKTYTSSQPPEIRDYLSTLEYSYPAIIESVEHHSFVSGYCNSITPISYTDIALQATGDALTQFDNEPYTCAVLVISIDEISDLQPYITEDMAWGDLNADNYGFVVNIKGTVMEVCSLAQSFNDPLGRTIHVELRLESEEIFSSLNLKIGEQYLIYGTNYMDLDWQLRQNIAGGDQIVYENISWENIKMLTNEQMELINANNHLYGIESKYVAKYSTLAEGEEFEYLLSELDLNYVESCSITVCANPSVAQGQLTQTTVPVYYSDGIRNISQDDYVQLYMQAGIIPLCTPASQYWSSHADSIWENALSTANINNHSFPIISTANLQSVAQFAMQDTFITTGRLFTQEEYDLGIPVCILSESLAVQNGLTVGDTITIQFYESDLNLPGQNFRKSANPSAAYYSSILGFSSEEIKYTIVGLYRQNNEWSVYDYAFTPNTIFVPKSSIACNTETFDSGIFCTYVLKNGMTEAMDAELIASGYEGLLSYYDQGFSKIAASLTDYFSVSNMIVFIGTVSWIIFIFVFLVLFPIQQKKEMRRMWTLGTSQVLISKHIVTYGLGHILPGFGFGGIVSVNLLRKVLEHIGDYANINLELSQPFQFVVLIVVAQIVFVIALVYLIAKYSAWSIQKE